MAKLLKQKKAIDALSALGHEVRLEIFRMLQREGVEGLSAGEISQMLQVAPATLSFHLAQLSAAGLVKSTRSGRHIIYVVSTKRLKRLIAFLTAYGVQGDVEGQDSLLAEASDEENTPEEDELPKLLDD